MHYCQSSVLLNFIWMRVLGILTEESTRQPDGLCPDVSHIHTTFNRDSVRTDKAH